MTQTVFRTIVVTAADAPLARLLAEGLMGADGTGMYTAALSATAAPPPSHYVSTGQMDADYAAQMADADALHAACVDANLDVTLAQCQTLVANSDVSEEPPFTAFARLGLALVQEEP